MFLLHSLNVLLDRRSTDDARQYDGEASREGAAPSVFPAGRLTSAAWAGWWHEDAA